MNNNYFEARISENPLPKFRQKCFRRNNYIGFGYDYGVRPTLRCTREKTGKNLGFLNLLFTVGKKNFVVSIDIEKK